MRKVTPDPPDADKASPNESSETRDEDDHHASFADIKATPRMPCTMYSVNPEVDVQTLLGCVSESLASASVITMDVADRETGPSRNSLLGVHQTLMLSLIHI